MSILALHVRSGLCNRLRPILAAIAYCEQTCRELRIHWPRVDPAEKGGGGIFDAGLSDLFTHPFKEIGLDVFGSTGRMIRQTEISLETRGDLHMRTINMFPGFEPEEGFPRKHESHQFMADASLYKRPLRDYWSCMIPSPGVQSYIDEGLRLIEGRPVVAAMIRLARQESKEGIISYDANFETPLRSPPDKFIARMKLFPSDTQFFLATDCQYVEDKVRAAFPDRILQLPQTYRYDKAGIQLRTAEMYIAAKCQKILGSYISSWCEFAGWLAGGKYSACYQWPAGEGEIYEDVGLWQEAA